MIETVDRYINAEELAEFLAVPITWVYTKKAHGGLPCQKVGHYVRFWLPDVLAWLKGHE